MEEACISDVGQFAIRLDHGPGQEMCDVTISATLPATRTNELYPELLTCVRSFSDGLAGLLIMWFTPLHISRGS